MGDFSAVVSHGAARVRVSVTSKKQLFQLLATVAAENYGLSESDVFERLTERERLGSTGFGGGIAIPHAKLDGLDRMRGAVLLLKEPIAFDAVDSMPVDVVFMLLSPADSGAEHLKMLARVSRLLRNDAEVRRLRGAASDDALHLLLSSPETRDAA